LPDISKINALAIGSISKVDGLAKASILDINGVAVPAGVAPPLDTYTGASAAYSIRLLRTAYTGDIMRVRRASDNVEADVGFDGSNELSLTSPISNTSDAQSYTDFADFVDHTGTPTDAFVRYWYDQSSNSNDAGQSTAGSQMQIYNGSAVITENGKPALQHGTVDGGLDITGYTGGTDATVLAVMADTVTEAIPIISFASGVPYLFRAQSSQTNSAYRGFGTSPNSFLNGVEDTSLTNGEVFAAFGSAQGLVIGIGSTSGWTGSTFHLGWSRAQLFQEVIFWNSDQDTAGNITGIQNNVNTYFSIYT
jgi:hypothetical protein